jgi:predicted PurR-regulated permease PerM
MAPILTEQLAGIAAALPGYIEQVRPFLMQLLDRVINEAGGAQEAKRIASQAGGQIAQHLSGWAQGLLAGVLHVFNLLSLLLITPIVAFYLLRDYDSLVERVDALIPGRYEPTIRRLVGEADKAMSGFVRGQTLVCVGVAIIYAAGWSLIGLQYGLTLGIITGALAFLPYVGQLFGTVLAVIIAISQFGPTAPEMIAATIGVFIIAQLIESNFLTPKLIGEQVGLHAVWVIFAVMAGASLMGFVGVFLAVPVAALVAVVGRWAVERYQETSVYRGDRGPDAALATPPSPTAPEPEPGAQP